MKKQSFLLILLFSLIYPAISQTLEEKYYCEQNTSIYSDCTTKYLIGHLIKGTVVFIKSEICTDNLFELNMIKVLINDSSKTIGWTYFKDLYTPIEFQKDSIIKEKENAQKIEKKRISDSIEKEKIKIMLTKDFWITEVFAYKYTNSSTGIVVKFLNISDKTIKYINFIVVPYNRVGDPVIDNMGKSSKSCQLIGPVNPYEEGIYQNDILFFSGVVDHYKLKNISVQYMENTMKYYKFDDILKKPGQF